MCFTIFALFCMISRFCLAMLICRDNFMGIGDVFATNSAFVSA